MMDLWRYVAPLSISPDFHSHVCVSDSCQKSENQFCLHSSGMQWCLHEADCAERCWADFSSLCVFKCLLKYSAKEIRKDRLCISKRWLFSILHFQRHAMRLLHETDCAERRWAEFTPCPSQSPTVKEGLVIWPHCIHWSHKNTGRKKEPMHQAKKGPKADAAPLPFITFFLLPNVGTAWWRSVWSLVCHWSLIKVLISMSLIICQDDHDHHVYHQASENGHIFFSHFLPKTDGAWSRSSCGSSGSVWST